MPHNRTRLWVGLAIAAITIPALGFAFRGGANDGFLTSASAGDDRWAAGNGLASGHSARGVRTRLTSSPMSRDYLSEVAGMTRGTVPNAADGTLADRTEQFYDNRLDWPEEDEDPFLQGFLPPVSDLPDPAETMAPNDPPEDAYAAPMDGGPMEEGFTPPDDGGYIAEGPSDREIYNEMLANFSSEDRDTFVRTWALMSNEQRQQVLDDYRNNN